MCYSKTKLSLWLTTTLAIFTLNFSHSVLAQSLFDNLLDAVVEQASKEVIDDLNGKTSTDKPVVSPPPSQTTTNTPRNKPQLQRPNRENHQRRSYKDWMATVSTIKNDRGAWITSCSIHTGGDGTSSISMEFLWGNRTHGTAPSITYSEATHRHMKTQLQGEQAVTWVVKTANSAFSYSGETSAGFDDSGIPFATNTVQGDVDRSPSLELLRAFAKGRKVTLYDDYSGGDLHKASLMGFSASYRQAAQWCGFSPNNVLNVAPDATVNVVATPISPAKISPNNLNLTFSDWQASAHKFLTDGEDWVTHCAIHTGGNGTDSIMIYATSNDGLPPHAPLTVVYSEAVSHSASARLQPDDDVHWFVNSGSNKDRFSSRNTKTGYNQDGTSYAVNKVMAFEDTLYKFTQGNEVILRASNRNKSLHTASLKGFMDAYSKMAQWCGFSAEGVLNQQY